MFLSIGGRFSKSCMWFWKGNIRKIIWYWNTFRRQFKTFRRSTKTLDMTFIDHCESVTERTAEKSRRIPTNELLKGDNVFGAIFAHARIEATTRYDHRMFKLLYLSDPASKLDKSGLVERRISSSLCFNALSPTADDFVDRRRVIKWILVLLIFVMQNDVFSKLQNPPPVAEC